MHSAACHTSSPTCSWGWYGYLLISGPDSKIFALTTDTGSNVKKLDDIAPWLWVPCFNHVLNLLVHDAIDKSTFAELIQRARSLAVDFRNIQALSMGLLRRQELTHSPKRGLILDVRTRWNSLFLMLERLVEEQDNILVVLVETKMMAKYLRDDDWILIKELLSLLKVFYAQTVYKSSQTDVTISAVAPMVHQIASVVRSTLTTTAIGEALKDALQEAICASVCCESRSRHGCS